MEIFSTQNIRNTKNAFLNKQVMSEYVSTFILSLNIHKKIELNDKILEQKYVFVWILMVYVNLESQQTTNPENRIFFWKHFNYR